MSESAPDQIPRSFLPRRRVLVVNCYFDYSREPIRRPTKFPQAVGPIFLAGAFSRQQCDVRCYDELSSGPLEDPAVFGWCDMLVLTGLTHCFDRLLHLTAYARTKNPKVTWRPFSRFSRSTSTVPARVSGFAGLAAWPMKATARKRF
jgi:hypothetical protein